MRRLLAGDDHVDVVAAAEAVVGDAQERVRVGRQIDPDHLRLLVDHVIDKSGVLVAEPVVVLPPDVRSEQVVERGDGPPPRNAPRRLQPLRVLVEHRIDDVNECLVAGEEPVPAGEQIAFQPALALMLAEHFHDAARRAQRDRRRARSRRSNCRLVASKTAVPAVGIRFVRAEDAEIAALGVALHHVADELALDAGGLGPTAPGEGTSTA